MNLHEFRIVPSAGHSGPGRYDRGSTHKNLSEVDLVDRYVSRLKDELEEERIRYTIAPTRAPPGIVEEQRTNTLDHVMPIVCAVGYNPAPKLKLAANSSIVFYGADVPKRLYLLLSEVIGHWGSLYVHGHRAVAPQPCERGLRLEPFLINGPSALEYAARLDRLGRDIGRALSDYCRQTSAGAVFAINLAPPQKVKAL